MKKIFVVVVMAIILSEASHVYSKDAIVFATFGTRSRGSATYNYIRKMANNQFTNYTIKWAYTSKKIREYKKEQSFGQTLQTLEAEGYHRVFVQPLFIFPAYEYLLLLEDAKKFSKKFSSMKIYLSTPLIHDDLDMKAVLDVVSKFFSSEGLNIIVAHGTKEKLGNFKDIYLNLANYIDNNYDNAVLVTIDGQPGMDLLTKRLSHKTYNKALFIPFMFTAGNHIEEDINSNSSVIKSTVKKYIKNLSILNITYNDSTYYMGLGLNRGIVDIFIKKLKKTIESGN
jgi:cobalamin biosynthesis Co2+ chelatase CbiK